MADTPLTPDELSELRDRLDAIDTGIIDLTVLVQPPREQRLQLLVGPLVRGHPRERIRRGRRRGQPRGVLAQQGFSVVPGSMGLIRRAVSNTLDAVIVPGPVKQSLPFTIFEPASSMQHIIAQQPLT